MAFTPRKTEVESVSAAIEDAESLDAVAKAALKESWKCVQRRDLWIVAVEDTKQAIGPYASEKDAWAALKRGKYVALGEVPEAARAENEGFVASSPGRATVIPLRSPLATAEKLEEMDREDAESRSTKCGNCNHPHEAHDWPGHRAGCVVRNCWCKEYKRMEVDA